MLSILFASISVAAQGMVASTAASGRLAEARSIAKRLVELAVAMAAIVMTLIWLPRAYLVTCFSPSPAVQQAALACWWILVVGVLPDGVASAQEGVMLGAGQHKLVALTTVMSCVVACGLTLLFFQSSASMVAVWGGLRFISLGRFLGSLGLLAHPSSPLRAKAPAPATATT